MTTTDLTEIQWERLAVRMLYKVCPQKHKHSHRTGLWHVGGDVCDQCGISVEDFARFIMGNEGSRS